MESKDRHFSKFDYEIVDKGFLSNLSNSAVRVYLVILRFTYYKTGLSYPNVETIVKLSGVNKNLICAATKELEKQGLIRKFRAGKEFGFKNGYRVIRHPESFIHIIPKSKEKRKAIFRGKDGKFKPIPKNTDNSIPQNTDKLIPSSTELDTFPQSTEKKKNLDLNRENLLEKDLEAWTTKGSQASVTAKNKSIKKVNPEIINEMIKHKGLAWVKKYLRDQGYDEKEIQELKEVKVAEKDDKQN